LTQISVTILADRLPNRRAVVVHACEPSLAGTAEAGIRCAEPGQAQPCRQSAGQSDQVDGARSGDVVVRGHEDPPVRHGQWRAEVELLPAVVLLLQGPPSQDPAALSRRLREPTLAVRALGIRQ
jgi:hypothetical protein